ncbi:MAG: type VI secretion system-associated protein TagF [Planctomycetes bacterium]|jgi:type VI secretion system ImpM family protein|nr:type VI secretion system-associated protein TagF [Planctomycetota bacterium]
MPPRSDLRTFCIGKLPIAGDFLHGASEVPEMAALDAWIEAGMERSQALSGGDWQARFDALLPARFLWMPATKGAVLAGSWWASRDAAGRRYPFVIGVRVPEVAPNEMPLLPAALAPFFASTDQRYAGSWAGLDVPGAIAAVRTMPCDVDLQLAANQTPPALHEAPTNTLWSGPAQHPELLLQHLAELAPQSPPPAYSLRWATRGAAVDVGFWLSVLGNLRVSAPRLLVWTAAQGSSNGSLRLALGRLEPKLFPGLLFADLDDENAYDLGRDHGDAAGRAAAQQRFGAAIARTNQHELLAALREEWS